MWRNIISPQIKPLFGAIPLVDIHGVPMKHEYNDENSPLMVADQFRRGVSKTDIVTFPDLEKMMVRGGNLSFTTEIPDEVK